MQMAQDSGGITCKSTGAGTHALRFLMVAPAPWHHMLLEQFDIIQSQPLSSSFKLIISFTFSSLMFKSSDLERLDKVSEVLVEF